MTLEPAGHGRQRSSCRNDTSTQTLTRRDIIPKILDASVVDHKVRVTSSDAARRCALLARFGIFAGQSSGAYLQGVYETAKRIRKGTIVTILNDIGERYMSTRLWEPGA